MSDFLPVILFICALALPLVTLPLVIAKRRKIGVILLIVYLGTYAGLSLAGSYIIANHGGMDWRKEWCPKFLVEEYVAPSGRTKTNVTIIGAVFWPCICLDHLLWHRTTEAEV
ncbi:MAG: hypothetical protein HOP33_17135 [Verrucomicrobia bacterium]|nr:hypothetical protein [Verrucomicrobiota bacterium]